MGKRIAFIYHDNFNLHYATYNHPECPERIVAIKDYLENSQLAEMIELIIPDPAREEDVLKVHSRDYLKRLEEACNMGNFWFDFEDTFINANSFDAALLSAGGAIKGVEMILNGSHKRAFCCIRPPGHHAEPERGMGFCLLNNAAIAALYAKNRFGLEKIMIIDWDAHHGNGTELIFSEDPSVFYISVHEHPSYIFPGTGRRWQKGKGEGIGFTLNLPLLPGAGDEEYLLAIEESIIPKVESFSPELLILSAGFDAHMDDPLSDMSVTDQGFRKMTDLICSLSEKYTGGRVVSLLEGGYNLEALKKSALAHIRGMVDPGMEERCLSAEE